MANINFGQFSFPDDVVRNISEALLDEMVQSPLLNAVFGTIETGVKNGKEIGFINTDMGLMLKSGNIGCSPTGSTVSFPAARKKVWDLKSVHFMNEECETATRATFLDLAKKAGIDRYDLTDTEYYALVQSMIAKNLAKNVFVKAWFDDTAAANVTGGGKVKNGVDITYLNAIDGVWKQLAAIYTATPDRKSVISANAGANYAAQNAITDADCTKAFNDVLRAADPRLVSASDKIYIATRSLVQGYRFDMQTKGSDSVMMKQIDGVEVPTCNGIPVIECTVWDETIRSYFDNGTKWDNPHRVVLTSKSELALAFQSDGAFDRFNVFYDPKSMLNIIRGEDQYDAKALRDYMFQVGI